MNNPINLLAALVFAHDTYRIMTCRDPVIERLDNKYAYFKAQPGNTLCVRSNDDDARVRYYEYSTDAKIPRPYLGSSTCVWHKAQTFILPAYLFDSDNLYIPITSAD